jgi:parallel beta-helix repeat protein
MKNKIVLSVLILSLIAFVFTGCDGNPVVPTTTNNICPSADEELQKIILELNISLEDLGSYSCDDLKNALNEKISSDGNLDLTYKEFILNAIYEEELIEDCLSQPFDKDIFAKWDDNLFNIQADMTVLISESVITGMIEAMGMSTLAIGIGGIFWAADLSRLGILLNDLNEIVFRRNLHLYLQCCHISEDEAGCMPQDYISSPFFNEPTEEFFHEIWNKYGDAILDNGYLDSSFKVKQHTLLKELILQALNQSPDPDLVITDLYIEPDPPVAGGNYSIGVDIKNQGDENIEETFQVKVYFDDEYIEQFEIEGLGVGHMSRTLTTSYSTWPSDTNLHTIKAAVDPDNIINESNESNNQYMNSFISSSILTHTIYVPDDYAIIQEAVNAASSGNTIIVREGTYIENVNVNKDHLTIESESGAELTVVQASNSDGNVFDVRSNYVNIIGFTVRGATGWINGEPGSGIYLQEANYCTINNNSALEDRFGIFLKDSTNCNIMNNTVLQNSSGCGIYLIYSADNNIENNTSSNNLQGIFLESSNSNELTGNNAKSNIRNGITLYSSSENEIMKSKTMENGNYDISSYHSSTDNIIYLNNLQNGYSENSNELWNSPEEISYTYNGKSYMNYLGNYWDNYTGSDADGDGIGDTPFIIDEEQDIYPLMEPFESYQ